MTVKELRDILNGFSDNMAETTTVAVNKGYVFNETIDVLSVQLVETLDLTSREQVKKLFIRID